MKKVANHGRPPRNYIVKADVLLGMQENPQINSRQIAADINISKKSVA